MRLDLDPPKSSILTTLATNAAKNVHTKKRNGLLLASSTRRARHFRLGVSTRLLLSVCYSPRVVLEPPSRLKKRFRRLSLVALRGSATGLGRLTECSATALGRWRGPPLGGTPKRSQRANAAVALTRSNHWAGRWRKTAPPPLPMAA